MTPDFYEHKKSHQEIMKEDFKKEDCYQFYFIRYDGMSTNNLEV
jgi:hypothetical protein